MSTPVIVEFRRWPSRCRRPRLQWQYNRHRYYDPHAGRSISKVLIGLAGGINVYQYAPIRLGGRSTLKPDPQRQKRQSLSLTHESRAPTQASAVARAKGGRAQTSPSTDAATSAPTSLKTSDSPINSALLVRMFRRICRVRGTRLIRSVTAEHRTQKLTRRQNALLIFAKRVASRRIGGFGDRAGHGIPLHVMNGTAPNPWGRGGRAQARWKTEVHRSARPKPFMPGSPQEGDEAKP